MAEKVGKHRPQMSADVCESSGHGAKLEAVKERAILALLSERTIGAAAERVGVNERTLRRWMGEEGFKTQLAQARCAAFQAGMSRVQALTGEAIETLASLMAPEVSAPVRLGAARTIAELGLDQHDAEMISSKLAELEAKLRQQEGRR
jgi:DNA-binding transcriptional MerR regulator